MSYEIITFLSESGQTWFCVFNNTTCQIVGLPKLSESECIEQLNSIKRWNL